jgi:hypothetical protein
MDLLEALNEYYKLKHEYDTKTQAKVNKILKDDTLKNMKQKQERFQRGKIPCISCKRNVGTIFSNKNGILSAICGDVNKPCNLDIKINRGKYVPLEHLIDVFDHGVIENKLEIIKLKLDLLFNFKSESIVIDTFKKLKDEIMADLETLSTTKTTYINNLTNLENKRELSAKMAVFYNKLNIIKSSFREYNDTGNSQLIKDVVSIYRNELQPVLLDIRNLKYKYQAVEFDNRDGTYHLIRKPYLTNDMMSSLEDPKVISFTIGTNPSTDASNATRRTKPPSASDIEDVTSYIL